MTDAKESTLDVSTNVTYHFFKESDEWILCSDEGGDIAYTPEIFEQYIRPHIRIREGLGDHLFHRRDISMNTVDFGVLRAQLAIHFFGGRIQDVRVSLGELDPQTHGAPVNKFVLRLPYMEGAPLMYPFEPEELDPVP